jgi:hypothetical protein
LDFVAWAHRLFGSVEPSWFDSTLLLANGRQAQQALRADWVLLPLREWAAAWWQARHGGGGAPAAPLRRLKERLADAALRSALADTLRALQSVTGASARLALQIDAGASWLAWAGATGPVDDDDAEEALVHVAALLHALSGSGIAAVVVLQHDALPADPASHFEALTNAAHHHGWGCALCASARVDTIEGFDAVAARTPAPGQGAWLADDDWPEPTAPGATFVVATIPAAASPDDVLARVEHWRRQV